MEPKIGIISWHDLTVPDAEKVSEFYQNVVGWEKEAFDMGGYKDYVMMSEDPENPAAGICHAKGGNKDIPPQWLMYVRVENLDESLKAVKDNGGKILGDKRKMQGDLMYCLIQDPAGAYMMLCG